MNAAAFETESKVFEKHRVEWAVGGQVDRWVAIHGEEIVGFWDDLGDAVAAVEKRFGEELVLIRRITLEDTPVVIQRIG